MDVTARNEQIIEYLPLVKFIAGRVMARLPQHVESGDLISAGVMGLIDAIAKFDAGQNVQFRTYAEFRIRGAMLDELRALDFVPRSVRKKRSKLDRAYAEVEQKIQRAASEADLAEHMGISLDEVTDLLSAAHGQVLLNLHELIEDFADQNVIAPAETIMGEHIAAAVTRAVNELPDKQRRVIALYYYERLTMREIGETMALTESRISQIHNMALDHLRESLRGMERELCAA